jgi:hypothetical protein
MEIYYQKNYGLKSLSESPSLPAKGASLDSP